jgi:hypothetical protein
LDQAQATAQGASTPPHNAEKPHQFLYWVVQRWDKDKNAYVDTDVIVYPGDTFKVLKDNARVQPITDGTETEEVYNGNCQHVKQYLDSLGTEVKVLKEASPEWYNDIIHLQASLEEHYKLLNTQSTSLDRYWGKHMILQSEIGNNIAAFKQKYMKD